MNTITKQKGASAIAVIIILGVIGVGAYIGLQYIPQFIETGSVDSVLDYIETTHDETPFNSRQKIQSAINRQLNMNQMEDLRENFKVTDNDDAFVIKLSYERELDLIYEKKIIKHDKKLTLMR